jgi:replicative DNA helicase
VNTSGLVPPHDVAAEEAIAASVLLEPATLDQIGTLAPDQFWSEGCRWVIDAAQDLAGHGRPVDVVAVAGWLREKDQLVRIGGSAFLAHLADAVPSVANIGDYADRVREKAALRRLISTCQRIAAEGYGDVGPVADYLTTAETRVATVAASLRDTRNDHGPPLPDDFMALTRQLEDHEPVRAVTTGVRDLDHDLGGGFESGFVGVLGGPTNWSKSNYCVMVADEAMLTGKRALIVSFEDPRGLYVKRLAARRGRLNAYRIKTRSLNDEEWNRYTSAAMQICSAQPKPLILAAAGRPIEHVAHDVERRCKAERYDIVIWDYLQAARCQERKESRRTEINWILRVMTDTIKRLDYGCAGLVVSQIRRLEPGEEPWLSDLKESGDIENSAETVVLGFNGSNGEPRLRLAKSKDGAKMIDYSLCWHPDSASLSGGSRLADIPKTPKRRG